MMQSWRIVLLAAAALLLAIPAQAADTATWAALAGKFGCPKKANEQHFPDDSFYMAQYIPEGQKTKNWTRIFTVQLFRAPADAKQSDAYIESLIREIPKNIESAKGGDVTVWQTGKGKDGPVAYGEFVIAAEQTVTVVYRVAKGVVAVNQFAVRKSRLTDEDKRLLKQLVMTNANPAPISNTPASPGYPRPKR